MEMEQELKAIVQHLQDCWNCYDSRSYAEVFAEDADFIHILGAYYHGREKIEQGHCVIFDTIYKGSRNSLTVQKIRPLGENAAVVFVESTLQFLQGGERVT